MRGSKYGLNKKRRMRERFQAGGLTSQGGKDLSKWQNILDTKKLLTKSIPVSEYTWFKAAL